MYPKMIGKITLNRLLIDPSNAKAINPSSSLKQDTIYEKVIGAKTSFIDEINSPTMNSSLLLLSANSTAGTKSVKISIRNNDLRLCSVTLFDMK